MYYNEKRKAITAKYVKTHLDDIKIRVPKGQREKLKSIASEMGMSMNQMFIKAVEEYIEKNYITSEELLSVFADVVSQSELLKGAVICLDVFTFFTPLQYRLLRELIKTA